MTIFKGDTIFTATRAYVAASDSPESSLKMTCRERRDGRLSSTLYRVAKSEITMVSRVDADRMTSAEHAAGRAAELRTANRTEPTQVPATSPVGPKPAARRPFALRSVPAAYLHTNALPF